MRDLPEGLSVLQDLETLSLSSNEITTLPTLIPPMSKTKTREGSGSDEVHSDAMETDADAMLTVPAEDESTPFFSR
jgi:Leucine-rich repeat (LRR) protein